MDDKKIARELGSSRAQNENGNTQNLYENHTTIESVCKADNATTQYIKNKLRESEFWTERSKDNGKIISPVICPGCGELSGWLYSEKPNSINCNRQNNCGVRTPTRELFPDITRNIEKEYPPTKDDPNRPATAFLQMRGISAETLNGLDYEYWKVTREGCGGGVMFPVGGSSYNGRLFNPPPDEGKTHNIKTTKGKRWIHPGRKYDLDQDVYVTEGIIDTLSLWEMGKQAIAILSSGQDPSSLDLSEYKKLVFAFDRDTAGRRALKKWKAAYPDARAVMPTRGDWNDLLLSGVDFDEKRQEFEFNARLALAKDAKEYAEIYFAHKGNLPDLFVFGGCYYQAYKQRKGEDKEIVAVRVSNFILKVDHFQLNTTNADEPENQYHLKIKPRKGGTIQCTVSASELSSPNNLITTFLKRARVLWEGERKPSLALARKIVESDAPVVRQLQKVGYDIDADSYVFQYFAIKPDGKLIRPNKQGFFETSRRAYIRPGQYPSLKPIKGKPLKDIYSLINQAWPNNGAAAFAWMVAGWFVNQVKPENGFFPFMSFYDDTQTGKTQLTRRLNACQCLDEEGLAMQKVNTAKGEIRKLAQRSGVFKALLEGNSGESMRLDTSNLLPLYNFGNSLQTQALKTNDTRTKDIPFLSSLLFVQNREPFKNKAEKERVISLSFKTEHITEETTAAFNELIRIPITELAYMFPYIMRHRQRIQAEWLSRYEKDKESLNAVIQDARISENHALITTFHDLVCDILEIKQDIRPFIEEIGTLKKESCATRDVSIADTFLDAINGLEPDKEWFVDVKEEGGRVLLYLNINGALEALRQYQGAVNFPLKQLQDSLKKHDAFVENEKPHRFTIDGERKQRKAWVFDVSKTY